MQPPSLALLGTTERNFFTSSSARALFSLGSSKTDGGSFESSAVMEKQTLQRDSPGGGGSVVVVATTSAMRDGPVWWYHSNNETATEPRPPCQELDFHFPGSVFSIP